MMENKNGILLTFARTGNRMFQKMLKKADAVFFFRKRIKFFLPDGTQGGSAGCDSCLFAFGIGNVDAIVNAHFEGVLIRLKQ